MTDTFKKLVYHVADLDLFIVVERGRKPEQGEHVVVDRGDGTLVTAEYHGQAHYGVIRVLDFIRLEHSEQWVDPNVKDRKIA
jgi:hypothetical protein